MQNEEDKANIWINTILKRIAFWFLVIMAVSAFVFMIS
jgi:hypothetical protein